MKSNKKNLKAQGLNYTDYYGRQYFIDINGAVVKSPNQPEFSWKRWRRKEVDIPEVSGNV